MSNCLYWLPPPEEREENSLYFLRYCIPKYLNWEGQQFNQTVGKEIVPYLKGLLSAYQQEPERPNDWDGPHSKIEEVQSLISAIEKYGKVELSMHS